MKFQLFYLRRKHAPKTLRLLKKRLILPYIAHYVNKLTDWGQNKDNNTPSSEHDQVKNLNPVATAIKLREPTSRGVSAGSSDVERFMDPADTPRDVGEEKGLNLMAVRASHSKLVLHLSVNRYMMSLL